MKGTWQKAWSDLPGDPIGLRLCQCLLHFSPLFDREVLQMPLQAFALPFHHSNLTLILCRHNQLYTALGQGMVGTGKGRCMNQCCLQLLAMAAGTIKDVEPEHAPQAHDYRLKPKPLGATFHYFARQVLRREADCLD